MTPVESVTALEQGIEKYRAWTEAKRDCDRKEVALEQARRKQQDNERAASAATTATCKGEGPYAACPLLGVGATALARRQALTDEVKQTEAAFVQARHAMPSAVDLAALGLRPGENDRQALERLRRQAREWAIYQDTHRRYDEAMQRYQAAGGDAVAQVALEAAQKRAGGQQEVEGAQAEVQRLQRAAGALKVALEQSATLVMQAEAREVEVQHEVQQRARWALLAEATGPGGYPSLEIAAAEPEIAAAAGEMLKGPFGERFRVRLATTRVTQAGVEKADCDVEVEDALFPDKVHKSVDGLSKGQRILVEEALRIGLTLFARKRMRTPILTAYRDEPEDGLDAHLVPYYIQMLHRGINLATLHGIWWITHEPLGWDAADAVIDVGSDSRVTLVMGG
jgi:DNA repair exonuclease SbcCD ATPase subunit